MRVTATALLITAFVCLMVLPCRADVHIVDWTGVGDFETVQEAVDAAAPEDTILVRAGLYEENVLSVGKYLTFQGEGQGTTTIRGVSDAPTFEIREMTEYPRKTWFHDMTIERGTLNEWAIYWDRRNVLLYDCMIVGTIGSWEDNEYGGICLYRCTANTVRCSGYGSDSVVNDSTVDSLCVRGEWYTNAYGWTAWAAHTALCNGSQIDVVDLQGGAVKPSGCTVSTVYGDLHADCEADDTSFESIRVGSDLKLVECTVAGDVSLIGGAALTAGVTTGRFKAIDCTITGDVTVDVYETPGLPQGAMTRMEHTSVLGSFYCDYDTEDAYATAWNGIRGNIIVGDTYISVPFMETPIVSYNDFVGGFTIEEAADSVYANISAPALFCSEPPGDLTLQDCSPCAGSAQHGTDMGAWGVGCPCASSAVEETTWGALKARFRQPSN